jgi:hypothetical protein
MRTTRLKSEWCVDAGTQIETCAAGRGVGGHLFTQPLIHYFDVNGFHG